jgi:maltokinase
VTEDLTGLLATWLPEQRWYGGKGQAVTSVEVEHEVILPLDDSDAPAGDVEGGDVAHTVLRVRAADGSVERYQLLVGRLDGEVPARLTSAVIGDVGGRIAYDAVHDPRATQALLRSMAARTRVDGVSFHSADALDVELTSRVMGAEQSNTSVVFGEDYILKIFRRLQPGTNPDLEITRALASGGSPHVAAPLGWIEGDVGGETTTLGLMQTFLRGASEGWAMATASVRDLFAEGDLHADEVGGDFAAESERLGTATAEVHALLADALPSATHGPAESQQTARQLVERFERALDVVPELADHRDGVLAAYEDVARRTEPVPVQRVHGDLHLGQVLRTQDGWVLLDFEGEPARPLAERTALMSPLRDVAGMLRSYDYAAQHLLVERSGVGANLPHLAYRATEWAERNRTAFCEGYAEAVGTDPRDDAALLRAFELDKAVYEVVYEARNRPSWLTVPLGSIERLLPEPTKEA